ncbi:hypothetical protein SARC_07276 [Sphaeroforma arctica JP610]|uniref:Uncharacterized protein n=1 Tax=Sphaeroforma arctica JP610 TaxID=667725 RepID=A0A0L0FWM8_9EUKA|nr:hypothetical protein SARC_07276 [Sphaeroforma arctica JP610]KNC80358.1 hypothetical protein SARC_07276 [Sphaeroforma arctica JP610]|eukprot:XP_014154260.1 hypothetical protein SARC_07276 [Sphaeroforma arctica JP610]
MALTITINHKMCTLPMAQVYKYPTLVDMLTASNLDFINDLELDLSETPVRLVDLTDKKPFTEANIIARDYLGCSTVVDIVVFASVWVGQPERNFKLPNLPAELLNVFLEKIPLWYAMKLHLVGDVHGHVRIAKALPGLQASFTGCDNPTLDSAGVLAWLETYCVNCRQTLLTN